MFLLFFVLFFCLFLFVLFYFYFIFFFGFCLFVLFVSFVVVCLFCLCFFFFHFLMDIILPDLSEFNVEFTPTFMRSSNVQYTLKCFESSTEIFSKMHCAVRRRHLNVWCVLNRFSYIGNALPILFLNDSTSETYSNRLQVVSCEHNTSFSKRSAKRFSLEI